MAFLPSNTNKRRYNSKYLFLLFFIFLVSSLYSQTTVQVGNLTSSTTGYFPIRNYDGYSYTQQIYTPDQIKKQGTITKLRFRPTSGSLTNGTAWVVYMGKTTKSSFSSTTDWVPVGSMTKVFDGTVSYPGNNNWMEITLSTSFIYNSTDNLLIAVDENTPSYGGSTYWSSFTSSDNTGIYYSNDGTNPNPSSPPTANGRSNNINVIQLVMSPVTLGTDLSSPNGGEEWLQGSSHNITWTNVTNVTNVELEYTTNNGTNWNTIIASTSAADLSYSWTIPSVNSTNCKVRIKNAATHKVLAESNEVFKITPPYINVNSPNGNENFDNETIQNITWTSLGVTDVKIEYTTDNGSSWSTIIASTSAAAGTYAWTVPSTPSTQCKIKISEASSGTPSDESNATFTIKVPTITLTSPNGGEIWGIGSKWNITWTRYNVTNVKIEYSTDNGSTWATIIDPLPATTGTYEWTIPNTPSTQCLVKISNSSGGSPSDQSDAIFVISPPALTLTSPNGGESWLGFSNQNITWTSSGINNVKLEYSRNNGISWTTIENSLSASLGTYSWSVSNYPSDQCKVRVTDITNSSITDASDGVFSITVSNDSRWWKLGENGFAVNNENHLAGTIGPDGTPYVVCKNPYNYGFDVLKFNGSHWESLGGDTFRREYAFSIKVAGDGTSYVSYQYTGAEEIGTRVMKNSGSGWSDILWNGDGPSSEERFQTEIILGSDGYPFLFYRSNDYTIRVKRYNGSSWTTIGEYNNPDNDYFYNVSFALASDNTPYLFFRYSSTKAKIVKHNGSAWVDVGDEFTGSRVADAGTGIALNSSNIPYIFFRDNNNGDKGTVLQFNGSSWVAVGTAGFTAGTNHSNNIAFTGNVPYVFFEDGGNSNKVTAMKFDGAAWVNVGIAGFTPGSIEQMNSSFAYPNEVTVPIVFFQDNTAGGGKKSAMKFSQRNITVTSPNGGEYFKPNSSQNITWTSSNITNVKIEYSTDNGTNWTTLTASTSASAESYNWVTPNGDYFEQCRVKVSDVDNPTIVLYSDGSDAVFSITPYSVVQVGTSNGTSEYLPIKTANTSLNYTQQIYTPAQINQAGDINKIIFRVDGSADNASSWDVYMGHTTKSSFSSNEDWVPVGSMTKVFSGDVTFPTLPGSLTITLSTPFAYNNNNNLVIAVHEKTPGSGGYHYWNKFTSSSNTGIYYYTTDGTIIDPNSPPSARGRTSDINSIRVLIDDPNPSITVTAPNGGENWVVGSLKNITWGYNKVDNVKIEYTTNGGTNWNTLTASTPANAVSYEWTIPNEVSADCKVRVSDASNASLNDESNAVFSIIPPYVTVTAPNGGENWNIGTSHNITWASEMVTNVKIEYTTNNGSDWIEIISSTAASAGTYAWTIPNAPSPNCLVKISEASTGTPNDQSNAVFTIPPPSITVTAPNGGETWTTNSSRNITWTSYGVANVKIEYTTNNGGAWIVIAASTAASAGTYSWTVPNTPSTQCKVRISEAVGGNPTDESNSTFTISAGMVRVKTPNGGETWAATSKNEITWTYLNVENIKIEYTTNNGSEWIEIIASTPAAPGSYLWTVPNNPSSSCKVRISDVSTPALIDPSNRAFTITAAPPAPSNIGGWALQFDGVDDNVSFSSSPGYNNSAVTIEAWINSTSAANEKVIACWGSSGNDNVQFRMQGGKLQFGIDAGGWSSVIGTTSINTGSWVHVAIVKSGTTVTLYVNGKQDGSGTIDRSPTVPTFRIGALYKGNALIENHYFVGNIDEVRIWNYARQEASIKRHMNRQHDGNDAGLISYYKMTDGSGTTLTDNKGSNAGTLQNGPLWKGSGCFAGPRYGLLFDGTDDYVHVNDHNSLDLTTDYTLEAWIKATTFKWLGGIISKYQTNSTNGYFLRLSGGGSFNDLNFDELTTTGLNLQTGVWYHIAAVKSGGTRKLYVNGLEVTLTGTPINVVANGDELRIGCDFRQRYFHGIIDEVRIWNTARTPAQIQENMMSTLTGYETGLQLYFRNDHLDGTNTYDISTMANNGTLTNFSAPGCWVVSNPYNTWMGGVNGNWSTAANWSLGTVPVSTDNIGLFYWSEGGSECDILGNPTVNNLLISGIANPTLSSGFTVNGTLLLQRDMNLSGRTITLGSSGYLNEVSNKFYGSTGSITTTRTLNNISNENIGGLGFVITSAANLGSTQITRGHTIQTAGQNEGISRYYNVTPTTNTSLNATATYYYHESELNGIEESDLRLFKSVDDGVNWTNMGGTVSTENNTVSLSGIDGFSRWTLGDGNNPLPVELSSFSAKATKNIVTLNWETKTEVDNYGFEIERTPLIPPFGKGGRPEEGGWEKIGFVAGSGNSNAPKSYSFKDNKSPAGKLLYRLKQIDNDGTFSFSEEIEVEVALPTEFRLEQNYPNPFNPTTKIEYQLPVNSLVKLELYSITGEKVSTLVNNELEAGYYTLTLNANELRLASGVYFYRLICNDYTSIKKILLLK